MDPSWTIALLILNYVIGETIAGEYCTDAISESKVRYCEYGCCEDSSSSQACCGYPIWIVIVGIVGGLVLVVIIIIAACCFAHKFQSAKIKRRVRQSESNNDRRHHVVQVSSLGYYPNSQRYSSAGIGSEYSYNAHELYEHPHFRQTFWTPDACKDHNLYSDAESHTGNVPGYLNTPDDLKSDRTNRSTRIE